jgi:hypothetical protein
MTEQSGEQGGSDRPISLPVDEVDEEFINRCGICSLPIPDDQSAAICGECYWDLMEPSYD